MHAPRSGLRWVAVVALIVGLATTATASAAAGVVIGAKAFAPVGKGWGTMKPRELFNGGDPSGLITQIHWTQWGGSVAVGTGRNPIFKPGGGYYAQQVPIKLRASAIGNCAGRSAYTKLSVREPSRPGGKFGPWRLWSGAASICTAPH